MIDGRTKKISSRSRQCSINVNKNNETIDFPRYVGEYRSRIGARHRLSWWHYFTAVNSMVKGMVDLLKSQ